MKCLYAGSFDPFTNGHYEIVKKSSKIFNNVYICISANSEKNRQYDANEMRNAIEQQLMEDGMWNVKVVICNWLVADYCAEMGINFLIRGLRNTTDYMYEENIANINHEINPNLETVYLRADMKSGSISSSMVRELLKYNKEVKDYVPPRVYNLIKGN